MCKSPSRICNTNSIKPVKMPLIGIVYPHSHSLKICRVQVVRVSVKRWRRHVIFWRCTDVSWTMRKPAVNCIASTNASSPLLHNCSGSRQKKNEERLAG